MTKASYKAAICGREGAYGVVFPDFFGCISGGDTLSEATEMAHEALQLHVEGMVDDGQSLPAPTTPTLDEVADLFSDPNDPTDDPWVTLIDVTVDVPESGQTIPVHVRADLVQRIAALAEATRSRIDSRRFIEDAVEHEIERYRRSA